MGVPARSQLLYDLGSQIKKGRNFPKPASFGLSGGAAEGGAQTPDGVGSRVGGRTLRSIPGTSRTACAASIFQLK